MKYYNILYLYAILFMSIWNNIHGQKYSEMKSLYDYVTSVNYTYVRPAENVKDATYIHITFWLSNLQDLDGNAGRFAVSGFFKITWVNNNTRWNPSDYDGALYIRVQESKVWKPYLFHANPYKSTTIISMKDSPIIIYYNGFTYWYPGVNFESSCDADVSFFPFDSQTCDLWIMPWQEGGNEISLIVQNSTVDLTYYSKNSQWDYVSSNMSVKTSWNALNITMTFKRHSTYFMLTMVFPIILLAVLNIFVFMIPADAGDRVGFAITILLSIAVYMTIVSDFLPSTATPRLSSVGIFLCINLLQSTLITICTILGLTVYYRTTKTPITGFWALLLKVSKACSTKQKMGDSFQTAHSKKNASDNQTANDTQKPGDNQTTKENKIPKGNRLSGSNWVPPIEEHRKTEVSKGRNVSWKEVGWALDKLFIFTFSVILGVISFSIIMDVVVGVN